MKKIVFIILPAFFLLCCKEKRTKLSDGDKVTIEEFIDFFPELKLAYQLSDTAFNKIEKDSATIGYKIFTDFVPDTVLRRSFGKKAKPQIYPLGRASVKGGETYIFIKVISGVKKAGFILVFDKDNKFITSMPLVQSGDLYLSQTAQMDPNYTMTLIRRKKGADGRLVYRKDAYVYNTAGVFTLILTESNDVVSTGQQAVINPIDTVSRKHKLSGDYTTDNRNFVSIRDGRKPGTILFFIHFEKDKGACKGELKGEAVLAGANKAVYRQSSGPCAVEFNFTASRVSIKEIGPCGTFRDIKCFFEGSYVKKKNKKSRK